MPFLIDIHHNYGIVNAMIRSVYALIASDEPEIVRYIGVTVQTLDTRLRGHWHDGNSRHRKDRRKADWMNAVKQRGAEVKAVLLATATDDRELFAIEKTLLLEHKPKGHLLNLDFIRRSAGKRKTAISA